MVHHLTDSYQSGFSVFIHLVLCLQCLHWHPISYSCLLRDWQHIPPHGFNVVTMLPWPPPEVDHNLSSMYAEVHLHLYCHVVEPNLTAIGLLEMHVNVRCAVGPHGRRDSLGIFLNAVSSHWPTLVERNHQGFSRGEWRWILGLSLCYCTVYSVMWTLFWGGVVCKRLVKVKDVPMRLLLLLSNHECHYLWRIICEEKVIAFFNWPCTTVLY